MQRVALIPLGGLGNINSIVLNKPEKDQVSWIKISSPNSKFNIHGISEDPYFVTMYGYWSWNGRLAEHLPFDYNPVIKEEQNEEYQMITHDDIPESLPVEDQPKIIGGLEAFARNVVRNFKTRNFKYSPSARATRRPREVIVEALINEQGFVDHTVLIQSLSEDFDEAVLKAVRRARYIPATLLGRPVKFWLRIPVEFIGS